MKRHSDLVLRTRKPDASHVCRLPFPAESDDPLLRKMFCFCLLPRSLRSAVRSQEAIQAVSTPSPHTAALHHLLTSLKFTPRWSMWSALFPSATAPGREGSPRSYQTHDKSIFFCKKGFPVSGPCSSPRQRRYSASRSEKER